MKKFENLCNDPTTQILSTYEAYCSFERYLPCFCYLDDSCLTSIQMSQEGANPWSQLAYNAQLCKRRWKFQSPERVHSILALQRSHIIDVHLSNRLQSHASQRCSSRSKLPRRNNITKFNGTSRRPPDTIGNTKPEPTSHVGLIHGSKQSQKATQISSISPCHVVSLR